MKIREVFPEDINACAELFVTVFSNPPWNENWTIDAARKRLAGCAGAPDFVGIMLEDSGAIHGFAVGNIQHYLDEKHYYLLELCVRTDRQREGLGSRIMSALKEKMEREGASRIYTLTARDTPAHGFYEKLGYYTSSRMVMMVRRLGVAGE
jgi:aminoglycoside 6'-N-acetyltransferase I